MPSSHDTAEGIASHLDSIGGLNKLAHERHVAGYDRRERLTEWVVLGRFYLDSCGNFSRCQIQHDGLSDLEPVIRELPPVLRKEDLFKVLPGLIISSSMTRCLPKPEDTCPECGEGWTVASAHDLNLNLDRSDVRIPRHRACARLKVDRDEAAFYTSIIAEAGFRNVHVTPAPNRYTPNGVAWAAIETPLGTIVLGWRKRVLNIDWSDIYERQVKTLDYAERSGLRYDGKTLFKDEDVTKDTTCVHAWGRDKAIEYLSALREAFGLKR